MSAELRRIIALFSALLIPSLCAETAFAKGYPGVTAADGPSIPYTLAYTVEAGAPDGEDFHEPSPEPVESPQPEAARPRETAPYARNGFYIAYSFPYLAIGGAFDGSSVVTTDDGAAGTENSNYYSVAILPELKGKGPAFSVAAGVRGPRVAFEFSYLRSGLAASSGGTEGDAWLDQLNMDGRRYFRAYSRLQPFLLMGVNAAFLTVDDGLAYWDRYDSAPEITVEDDWFTGFGVNGGAGLSYYLDPRLAVSLAAVYRMTWYLDVNGADSGIWISFDDYLDGGMLDISVGVGYTF